MNCVECGCGERLEGGGPGRAAMSFLIGTGVAMLGYGGLTVARGRPRWLPLWLTALTVWFTLCKYLICTRCEYFGEPCDFYYLGRWAAVLFERQPERTLDAAGIIAEGSSAAVLQLLPVFSALRKPAMLARFLVLLALNQGAQLAICCRRCVERSSDPWKASTCPSYRLARRIFSV